MTDKKRRKAKKQDSSSGGGGGSGGFVCAVACWAAGACWSAIMPLRPLSALVQADLHVSARPRASPALDVQPTPINRPGATLLRTTRLLSLSLSLSALPSAPHIHTAYSLRVNLRFADRILNVSTHRTSTYMNFIINVSELLQPNNLVSITCGIFPENY